MNTTRTVAPSHPPCTPAQQAGAIAREAARGWVGLGAIWSVRAQYRARGPAEYRDEARPRWSPGTEEGRKGGPTRTRARACVGAPDVISSRRLLAARARLSPCPGAGLGELSGSVRPRVVRERRCWDGTYALPGRLRPSCSQPARDDVRAAPRPHPGGPGAGSVRRRFSPNIHSPVLVSPASRRSSKPSPISVLSSSTICLLAAAAADNRGTLNPKKAME